MLNLERFAECVLVNKTYEKYANLKPLWQSLGYDFTSPPITAQQEAMQQQFPSTSFAMLDLVASTVDGEPIESKSALFILTEGLYSSKAVAPDGTYPFMEKLVAAGREYRNEVEEELIARPPSPPPFRPYRRLDKKWLETLWELDNHHKGIMNAVELTPTRWSDYRDKSELEVEELIEANNREMLRRELIIEDQVSQVFAILSVFYHSASALPLPEGFAVPEPRFDLLTLMAREAAAKKAEPTPAPKEDTEPAAPSDSLPAKEAPKNEEPESPIIEDPDAEDAAEAINDANEKTEAPADSDDEELEF